VSFSWCGTSALSRRKRHFRRESAVTVAAAVAGDRLSLEWTVAGGDAQRMAEAAVAALGRIKAADAAVSPSDFPLAGLDHDELALVLDGLEET
ncbi:MAG TPA: hypothetical protein VJX66_13295, partial [Amycolatopsis sp.]|nr:hypothetical protein [Amycolatopsis sp.]